MARVPSASSGRIAAGGVLAAGSLAVLWLACLAPSGRLGLTAAAGLFPMAAVLAASRAAGWLCWAASGILGLILLPDKGVALLYLTFLGLYPVAKGRIESLRRQPVEWCLKLAFFNLVLTLFWVVFRQWFLPNPPAWLTENGWVVVYAAGNLCFAAYDVGLSRLVALLLVRMRPGKRG